VPPSEREKVFDLFYSTRKGGTGLGLTIARRIARAHGGEIRVADNAAGGATFSLALPLPHQGGSVSS
jgi:signal transduction histidine kinase